MPKAVVKVQKTIVKKVPAPAPAVPVKKVVPKVATSKILKKPMKPVVKMVPVLKKTIPVKPPVPAVAAGKPMIKKPIVK